MQTTLREVRASFQNLPKDAIPITSLSGHLRRGEMMWVHPKTGVVTTDLRMSMEEVLSFWSDSIFPDQSEESYSGNFPYAQGRMLYVLQSLVNFSETSDGKKSLVDFATGEARFLDLASKQFPEWRATGIEGSESLVKEALGRGRDVFCAGLGIGKKLPNIQAEFGSFMWTLSCCVNPLAVLLDARQLISEGGYVVVAESSRVLVPFKKTLADLVNIRVPADSHPFYFSQKSLAALMKAAGFELVWENRWFDSDAMVLIGRKENLPSDELLVEVDDPEEVLDFFKRWADIDPYFESLR